MNLISEELRFCVQNGLWHDLIFLKYYCIPINLSTEKHINRFLCCQNVRKNWPKLRFLPFWPKNWPKMVSVDLNKLYCFPINVWSENTCGFW